MKPSSNVTRRPWLEAGLGWLYTHHRRRYIWILMVITAVAIEGAIPVLVFVIAPVLGEGVSAAGGILKTFLPLSLLGFFSLYGVIRTHHGSAVRYLRGDDPAPSADDVWISSVAELPRGVLMIACGYWAPLVVGAILIGHLYGGSIALTLIFIYGVTVSSGLVGVVFFLLWETAFRPLARELAPQLSADILTRGRGSRLSTKLFVLLLATSLFNGFVVGSTSLAPASHVDRAMVAALTSIAVSLGLAATAIGLLRRSFVTRVDELRIALDKVEAGARDGVDLPPLAGDDLDEVVRSFNAMTRQLQQGEQDLRMSRARIVVAADDSRRRIERNIHDGAQQRMVALALDLRMLEDQVSSAAPDLSAALHRAGDDLKAALAELRELARGLHPSILTTDGLGPAIAQLASRSAIPVEVNVTTERFPEAIETACYFTAAEAMANVAKYAKATEASVSVERNGDMVQLQVSDNGCGGADPQSGSGLTGLVDRIAALDGTLVVLSPVGVGTAVTVEIPISGRFRAVTELPAPEPTYGGMRGPNAASDTVGSQWQ